jgi:hypothetical protein
MPPLVWYSRCGSVFQSKRVCCFLTLKQGVPPSPPKKPDPPFSSAQTGTPPPVAHPFPRLRVESRLNTKPSDKNRRGGGTLSEKRELPPTPHSKKRPTVPHLLSFKRQALPPCLSEEWRPPPHLLHGPGHGFVWSHLGAVVPLAGIRRG